jgi:carboxypeptidase C (cathepsin A)
MRVKIYMMSSVVALSCMLAVYRPAMAQGNEKEKDKAEEKQPENAVPKEFPKEESSVTDHSIKIGGQTIGYKATVGSILLKNDKDEPQALIYYTAYTRSDVKDASQRPLAFLYNGGPGSSSIWLHMGSFGPKRVSTADAETTPPAPYKIEDNPNCLLDKTDLVFIDPVGTGFSHAVGKAQNKDFWGIDADARSLANFVRTYVSRNQRWNSAKFLIGESYGTFRNAALANVLQRDGLYLNGLVMMSSVWDLGTLTFYPGEDIAYILYVPSYAATAWYHNVVPDRPNELSEFVDEARKFAMGEYADALLKGDTLTTADKSAVAKKLARFTGLSEEYLVRANLRVKLPQFQQELQRSHGLTTGRLDSRFSGPMLDLNSERAQYDPQSMAVKGAYVAAFNAYIRDDLKFGQDRDYNLSAHFGDDHWDWKHKVGDGDDFPSSPNVMEDLANALVTNPKLQVEVEEGYYDLATPFAEAEYGIDHLGLPENLRKNIHHKYYEAGHMMYLRGEDASGLKANVAAFIEAAARAQ